MQLRTISLEDRLRARGPVLMNGTQALVRLLLLQREADRARGLETAGFVSGYRGSPLGGLDQQLWRARTELEAAAIRFQPGVNEDLAATAIWGTQQVPLLPGATVQGVFALWYGKGPGADRSGDPFRHGNRMGTSPHGGVLVAVGDDHTGKSSTVAYQSEQALVAAGIPVLYPASVQEFLDFGLLGWALSRYAGLWVGMKCINETVETTTVVEVGPQPVQPCMPGDIELPPDGLHARIAFDPLGDDVRLQRYKLPAAAAFARANGLDRCVLGAPGARLGLIAAGKSAVDALAALELLGIDAASAAEFGVALYRPGMIWPLETSGLRSFARGCRELLVIEEKADFLEAQIARALYNLPAGDRPRLAGKTDEGGARLLPGDVALDPIALALLIAARLQRLGAGEPAISAVAARAALLGRQRASAAGSDPAAVRRSAYFCPGCPHNTSTQIPEGSLALSGIGCHTLVIGMDRRTLPPTQMGGEGMTWAGIAPFTRTAHVFQNMGDGTYFHSGLLAIRAAVAAGLNITYKLLVNDAVAMTGGQPVEGGLAPPRLSQQLAAEGVRRIALVSDDVDAWRAQSHEFARGTTFHTRGELEPLQRELRDTPGVTALIYSQTCAAEKRRRRKRGLLADPEARVFINTEVCEGCGDCSVKSNCLAIEPVETALGRKRRINQSACNKDYSCPEGFCPSFVLVDGVRPRRGLAAAAPGNAAEALPDPVSTTGTRCRMLIAGIGGTGIVTIGAVIAMAAHLCGRRVSVYDMTGLAQKGGAVLSHLRLGEDAEVRPASLHAGEADVIIGCDLVVAASPEALEPLAPGRTRVLVNTHPTPVADFQRQRDFELGADALIERLRACSGPEGLLQVDASELAERAFGDAIGTNMLLVGYALQAGLLPLPAAAIERAIELNGAAVELNRAAFRLGRTLGAGQQPASLSASPSPQTSPAAEDLDALVADRSERLVDYQDEAYAARYRRLVERARDAEGRAGGDGRIARAVARSYYRLLAIKDEYEVARLYTDGRFARALGSSFEGTPRLRVLLAPPLLARRGPDGMPRKRAFGPWIFTAFALLARLRRLRGTPFDPFAWSAERRTERALLREYEELVTGVLAGLGPAGLEHAAAVAAVPEGIRGFGHIRLKAIAEARARWRALL